MDEYQSIPMLQNPVDPSSDEDSGSEHSNPWDSMIKAMDDMNVLMMHMNGITLEMRSAQ